MARFQTLNNIIRKKESITKKDRKLTPQLWSEIKSKSIRPINDTLSYTFKSTYTFFSYPWTLGNTQNLLVPGSSSANSSWQKPKKKTIGKKIMILELLQHDSKYEKASIIVEKKIQTQMSNLSLNPSFRTFRYFISLSLYFIIFILKNGDSNSIYHWLEMRIKRDTNMLI